MPTTINPRLISWASDVDPGTIRQAEKAARMEIVEDHIALMPDAHVGMGATVGSVIPTRGAVIPSAVGVDIGCGMVAAELDVTEDQLPDSLEALLVRIERAIPAGVGKGHDLIDNRADHWLRDHRPATDLSGDKAIKAAKQFGTLGSGNHFVELCVDERSRCWVVLHSGSRGIGNQLAQAHIAKAKKMAKEAMRSLEDPDLAYFVQATPEFEAYITDMGWAQDYARANRDQMMNRAMREVFASIGFGRETQRINCHHNFTQREVHDGRELWVTRKGAIKADVGDLGVIPGSMGTRSYIVSGKGNPASWMSCSHGAGRRPPDPGQEVVHGRRPRHPDGGKGVAGGPGQLVGRRDPGGVQGHRPGHGRPGRPGGDPPYPPPGPQLQGHLTRANDAAHHLHHPPDRL